MKTLTFKKWLRENYGGEAHRYNDLLKDAIGDKEYPWHNSYEEQFEYITHTGACVDCLETLRDAYFDYLSER